MGWTYHGFGYNAQWSPDSTRVAFMSIASNLVLGDTNDAHDEFVKELATGTTQRISTDATGAQASGDSFAPEWSPNGAAIAFGSMASNLVPGDTNQAEDVFVKTLP